MSAHGAISEPSLIDHIGKGREGKGREVGHPSIPLTEASRAEWMSGYAAEFGGGC